MTLTAQEVVSQYLQTRRQGRGEFGETDKIIIAATREIVEEMPDGFRRRDVVNCVKTMTADTEELAEIKAYRRTLVAGKALAAMVDEGVIKEQDGAYYHIAF
jgi:cephalosporin hydroxylase